MRRVTVSDALGKITTIIPSFNRAHLIGQAIESVMAQDYPNIEVIVVDDGSTDGTEEVLRALSEKWSERLRTIRIANSGPGPAREAGRQQASGDYIQYLDSDDRLLPGKFRLQVAALESHPECGIAYGKTRLVNEAGEELKAPFKWTGRDFPTLFPWLLVDRWWCTHTPLYRRSVTDAIGPWSDLPYSQDWEYDARAGALGIRLVNCPEYVSEHLLHAGARQTGNGRWLAPPDRVRFFFALFAGARKAEVKLTAPEMRHFSRWVFRQARECALLGDAQSASKLCSLTANARESSSIELSLYRTLSRLLGWSRVARWSERARSLLATPSDPGAQKQSWMN